MRNWRDTISKQKEFLESRDIENDMIVTIRRHEPDAERFDPSTNKKKPVDILHFDEVKPIIMNKTNGERIEKLYGPDVDKWPGKKITLYVDHKVRSQGGKIVSGIRVRQTAPVLEKLDPKHPKWADAVAHYKKNPKNLEGIKRNYSVDEAQLKEAANG